MPRRPWPAAQPIAGYGPIDAAVAAGLASRTAAGSARTAAVDPAKLSRALEAITFGAGKLSLPRELAVFGDGDRIARVVEAPDGARAEIYDAPRPGTAQIAEAKLRERLTIKQAQRDPALVALIKLGVGVVGVVHPGGLGPILFGHWVEFDVAVPFVVLSNGSETAILVLSSGGAPLLAGKYSLHFVLDRDRWSAVVAADPEQHYHDEHAIALAW
ncbi:MAG: hypothetical protein HY303_06870, partial [Candidatus Wallbacteria bacterium]|nr:hypothetical protein [Candidatus Wallbacteria bacterium]